jgi:hypothetical protein
MITTSLLEVLVFRVVGVAEVKLNLSSDCFVNVFLLALKEGGGCDRGGFGWSLGDLEQVQKRLPSLSIFYADIKTLDVSQSQEVLAFASILVIRERHHELLICLRVSKLEIISELYRDQSISRKTLDINLFNTSYFGF